MRFKVKVYRNERDTPYVGSVGGTQGQRSNLMQVAHDLNQLFAQEGLNYYARVEEAN